MERRLSKKSTKSLFAVHPCPALVSPESNALRSNLVNETGALALQSALVDTDAPATDGAANTTWRSTLLSTAALAPLMLYGARQVRAQTVPPAAPCNIGAVPGVSVTCQGDVSAGVASGGDAYSTINVNNVVENPANPGSGIAIEPAASVSGIQLTNTNFNSTINSNLGAFSISTTGNNAQGIFANSQFGSVTVDSTGDISTQGDAAGGILALSIYSAATVMSTGNIATLGAVANGIYASSRDGAVTVTSTGDIVTQGDDSNGIYAVTPYGAATVTSTGDITTKGSGALGIGAGSYNSAATVTSVGNIMAEGDFAYGIVAFTTGGSATVDSTGDISTQGLSGNGIFARADNGSATVTSTGDVTTQGDNAQGVLAYSLGAAAVTSTGDVTTQGDNAQGVLAYSFGAATVTSTGDITTQGDNSVGIFANSVDAATVTSTGNVETQGNISHGIFGLSDNDNVTVTSTGNISTQGIYAFGLAAYTYDGNIIISSTGDISASGAISSAIVAGIGGGAGNNITIDILAGNVRGGSGGGAGVTLIGGDDNMVTNHGDLSALSGNAIFGGPGNDHIWNYGTITGNIDLDGGSNSFHNHASGVFNMGPTVNVGAGNDFINDGTIDPGGPGTIATTAITGNFTQNASGVFVVDLNPGGVTADLITVSGTANVAGSVLPLPLSPFTIATGKVDILTATGGVTNNGVGITDTAVVDYTLLFPNPNTMALGFVIDFTPALAGLTPNQSAVGNYLNNALGSGGGGITPLLAFLIGVPDPQTYVALLDRLHPEAYLINGLTAIGGSTAFAQAVLDCDSKTRRNTLNGASDDNQNRNCFWAEGFGGKRNWDRHRTNIGHHTDFWGLRGGFEMVLGGNVAGGLSFSFEDINTDTSNPADSDGQHYQVAGSLHTNLGGVDIAGIIHGGWGDFDVTRPIHIPTAGLVARGDQDIATVGARLEFAAKLLNGPVMVEPIFGVGFVHVRSDSLRETGGSAASLLISGFDETFFYFNPAIHIQGNVQVDAATTLSPFARFGLMIYDDERIDTSSRMARAPADLAPFNTIADLDQVVFEAAAGLDATVTNSVTATLGYDGKFSEHARTHQGSVRVTVEF